MARRSSIATPRAGRRSSSAPPARHAASSTTSTGSAHFPARACPPTARRRSSSVSPRRVEPGGGAVTLAAMSEPQPPAPRHLTRDEVAIEARVAPAYVDELAAAGAIEHDADGNYHADDVRRVRLAWALNQGGIGGDDLLWAMSTGLLPMDQLSRTWPTPGPVSRTFGSLRASVGERADLLASVYSAFGLAAPGDDSVVAHDEESIIRGFIDTWALVDEGPEAVIRAARIAGEGVRRIQEATLDLFDEYGGSPPQQMQRGRSVEDANRPSIAMIAVMADLLPWLLNRHSEDEVFRRIVAYIEARAAEAGRVAVRDAVEPAIAF